MLFRFERCIFKNWLNTRACSSKLSKGKEPIWNVSFSRCGRSQQRNKLVSAKFSFFKFTINSLTDEACKAKIFNSNLWRLYPLILILLNEKFSNVAETHLIEFSSTRRILSKMKTLKRLTSAHPFSCTESNSLA